ncbi:MFS transporter [Amycolatopsis anabasis]|uniref:MFS transporter n=1 Tax=Amycolatopsis anabasis TaxID=1840409 RepID=UPI00131E680E|nr:aromatic acid/H+ symport family MFS transporter [Amycolatopsis anabasis]
MDIASRAPHWPRSAVLVVAVCFVTVIFDGYDLIVYGAVIPLLLHEPGWALGPAEAGTLGSYALLGMLIGALVAGTVTDLVGRRPVILACLAWFSVAMGACALASSPQWLGVLRFVAGLGLGGVIPTATALTLEYAPAHRRNFTYALMFSGWAVGGVLTALVGQALLPAAGWRTMFAIGALPLVLVLPLAWWLLPESVEFLRARGRSAEATALARKLGLPDAPAPRADERTTGVRAVRALFTARYRVTTMLFWVTCFLGLLLVYGLNTWLPQIMRQAGFSLGSALGFLLALNAGTILSALVMSWAADRRGHKPVIVVMFAVAAAAIVLLTTKPPLALTYVLIVGAGFGVGTQILLNSFVGGSYPVGSRASALGTALGVGRFGAIFGPTIGGYLVAANLGAGWNLAFFAGVALLAAAAVALVPRPQRHGATATNGIEPRAGTFSSGITGGNAVK